jgi:exodeoxyribonuclease III
VIARRRSVSFRLHHAAAAVTLADGFTFVSTHLNPFSGERRRREATWLAARFGAGRAVIAGDLNSLDPHTDHSAALAGIDARRHLLSDKSVDTRAIAAFESAGWRDAGLPFGGLTVPTKIGGHEFGPMRLDYLMASPSMGSFREVRVLRDDETAYASDHYPVRADL